MELYWMILLPPAMGSIALFLSWKKSKLVMMLLQIFLVVAAGVNFWLVRTSGEVIQTIGGWPLEVGISLRNDTLASVMILLTVFIYFGVLIFNFQKSYSDSMFLFLLMTLQGLMIGMLLSNDLFTIFVLIEVATVIISLLIMYKKDTQAIYDGLLYLLTNVVGMTFFLMGLGMLYKTTGVTTPPSLSAIIPTIADSKSLFLPYAFILTGVSLKIALVPVFSWLPKAHGTPSAPSVISAVLSGLYVKNGVYLFLRLQDVFASQIDTDLFFLGIGFLTAVVGFTLAIAQKDIKLILAYHTISQIGLIMMGINTDSPHTYWGGVYHMVSHAFFKSTLFLTAGMIIDEYKTRDVYRISGVFKTMPFVSVISILAVLGITGAPLFNGSISKYFISYGMKDTWLEYGLILVNLGTIVSFLKYSRMFQGRGKRRESKKDYYRKGVIFVFGAMCFIGGIFGVFFIEYFFAVPLQVNTGDYWIKGLLFFMSILVGWLIYRYVVIGNKWLERIRNFDLNFNQISMCIVSFFGALMAYLHLFQ
ncbi:MAG TPA: proton-conducting membrane transporter [Eubacteriaceae bacterium]|nr:proton-conducting membrane transporter [Eubacteriaceae bacterium]